MLIGIDGLDALEENKPQDHLESTPQAKTTEYVRYLREESIERDWHILSYGETIMPRSSYQWSEKKSREAKRTCISIILLSPIILRPELMIEKQGSNEENDL